jgi:hypothetical protein
MSWRDGLGKSKYKTKKRKKRSNAGRVVTTLVVLCVAVFALYQSGTLHSLYEKTDAWMHPAPEKIVETKVIETTVIEPIIVEKTSTETAVIMPEGNWYKYDTSNSHYEPVSDMAALIEQLHVTAAGQEIVGKTEPRFESEEEIVKQNGSLEGDGVIILGLWTYSEYKGENAEEIMLLAPDDERYERCGSDPKVTLMHELLHSIDYNDDSFDADDFGSALARMYPEMYKEIKSLGYEDDHVNDELFARVGSEKADAPQDVKDVYARYFEDWGARK